jgi:predicted nucleotide-binding protein
MASFSFEDFQKKGTLNPLKEAERTEQLLNKHSSLYSQQEISLAASQELEKSQKTVSISSRIDDTKMQAAAVAIEAAKYTAKMLAAIDTEVLYLVYIFSKKLPAFLAAIDMVNTKLPQIISVTKCMQDILTNMKNMNSPGFAFENVYLQVYSNLYGTIKDKKIVPKIQRSIPAQINSINNETHTGYPLFNRKDVIGRESLFSSIGEKQAIGFINHISPYPSLAYLNETDEKQTKQETSIDTKKIFIVHGRDEGVKAQISSLLLKMNLEPIILHQEANEGQTLIEKFEKHADVRAAIILFTCDDVGKYKDDSKEEKRPRQNVIFEAGYFMGKLGRKHTIILAENGLNIQSDLQGYIYIPLDEHQRWHFEVARELKVLGFTIDMNKLV